MTVAETGPTLTIAAVDGNNVINAAEAHASGGVPLSGTVSGIAANSTFTVTVTDNGVTHNYTATVNAAGTSWSATIPSTDAQALANGTATVSAQVTDVNGKRDGKPGRDGGRDRANADDCRGRRQQRHQRRGGGTGRAAERHGERDRRQQHLHGDGHRQWRDP